MNNDILCKAGRALLIGYGAPVIAIVVYLFFWPLYFAASPGTYLTSIDNFSFPPRLYAFNDLEWLLKAIDCARQGVTVTLSNACMGGEYFFYSSLVLKAAALPLGASQLVPLGLAIDGLFLLSLFVLPRPRRWREFWLLLLAALSSSTLWAIESANIDVALYVLILGGIHLLLRGQGIRLAGYATLLGAAAIKFYPACLMILATRERPGRFLAIAAVTLAAALLLVVLFPGDMGQILRHLPQGSPKCCSFSATNVPRMLALLANAGDDFSGASFAMQAGSMIFLIGMCALLARRFIPMILPNLQTIPLKERILLVSGSMLIVFCFFSAKNNFFYREIFLLPVLPGLWALERETVDQAHASRFRFATWVVVGLLWSGFFWDIAETLATDRFGGFSAFLVQFGVWAMRETLWWWLVSLLASIVLCFLWQAPVLARWRR